MGRKYDSMVRQHACIMHETFKSFLSQQTYLLPNLVSVSPSSLTILIRLEIIRAYEYFGHEYTIPIHPAIVSLCREYLQRLLPKFLVRR